MTGTQSKGIRRAMLLDTQDDSVGPVQDRKFRPPESSAAHAVRQA